MGSSSKANLKIIAILAALLVFYNEFFVYWTCYFNWPKLHKNDQFYHENGSYITDLNRRPLRLLLVADPQLIGENDEPWYQSWIARWDSDRYLRSSFALASSYAKPDAIVYLGDLFDEGLKSSDEQFERYYARFKEIFKLEQMTKIQKIKHVFLSGDNDIGGEYVGDRFTKLEERFEKYFGPLNEVFTLNSYTEFIKLDLDYQISFYNKMKREYILGLLKESQQSEAAKSNYESEKLTIVLNHLSLLRKSPHELNALNEDTNAGLIIKGDSHKFDIIKYSYLNDKVVDYINYHKNPSNYYILNLQANRPNHRIQTVYELSIPTCSYRMGVPNMGFGLLTISSKETAYVSVLWLPSRYACLKYYGLFLVGTLAYVVFGVGMKRLFKYFCRVFFTKFNNILAVNKFKQKYEL